MTDYGPSQFAAEFGVSRETMARFEAYDRLLIEASSRMNLVARSTLEDRWDRHFRDSAQIFALVPDDARTLVDLGSGAGFPGLVLAAMLSGRGVATTLVESVGKKAAFLRAAAAAMDLDAIYVRAERIESLQLAKADVITARALANLPKLLDYVAPITTGKTVCIFPKGQDVEEELTLATKSWRMTVESRESLTRSGSQILILRDLRRKSR